MARQAARNVGEESWNTSAPGLGEARGRRARALIGIIVWGSPGAAKPRARPPRCRGGPGAAPWAGGEVEMGRGRGPPAHLSRLWGASVAAPSGPPRKYAVGRQEVVDEQQDSPTVHQGPQVPGVRRVGPRPPRPGDTVPRVHLGGLVPLFPRG